MERKVDLGRERPRRSQRRDARAAALRSEGLQRVDLPLLPNARRHCLTLPARFHSEGRIVSMIFGLLFWDVLFSAVPGAFETPYQSAPLDIAEDTFYHAREAAIEERLAEIEAGRAAEILAAADDRYRPAGTWCVGVRWDAFEKADLVEIAKVWVPKPVSTISSDEFADLPFYPL